MHAALKHSEKKQAKSPFFRKIKETSSTNRDKMVVMISLPSKKFLICCCSVLFLKIAAQPQVQYLNPDVKLGDILWKQKVTTRYQLKNVGDRPMVITDVKSSCGCMTTAWTRTPIAPGEVGTITLDYDAATLGTFVKTARVQTNGGESEQELQLSGRVVREIKNSPQEFPFRIGEISLSTDNLEFDDISKGTQSQQTIHLYNGGKKNYMPELMHLPKYLTAYAEPEILRPGKSGKLHVTLNSNELQNLGLTQTNIYLSCFPGDRVSKANEIGVSTMLLPPQQAEGIHAYSPKAVVDTLIDLGSFSGKNELKGVLLLANQGRSPLEISALQVYNPGISVSLSKSRLKPGEKAKLKITAAAHFEQFRGSHRILLITNDPTKPKIIVRVRMKK